MLLGTAGVAQLVEQLICNQQVGGSNPSTSSTISYGGIPERPNGADCKSVVTDFGGSNPPSPTNRTRTFVCVRFFIVRTQVPFVCRPYGPWGPPAECKNVESADFLHKEQIRSTKPLLFTVYALLIWYIELTGKTLSQENC